MRAAREISQIKAIREGCHLARSRTNMGSEVRDWHKSSGELHPFPFQCWASSAIDLQIKLGRIRGISSSSRECVRPGDSAPKRDAGRTCRKAERTTTQTLKNPKEVKGGQPVFREEGWETRGCIQMDQIPCSLRCVTGGKRLCSSSLVQNHFSCYTHVTEISIWLASSKGCCADSIS